MAHQRQLIREAVKAALLNQTSALDEISTNRLNPYRLKTLPAIDIVTISDDVEETSTAPRELESEYVLEVRGWVKADEKVDDTMDDLALEVEAAMHADPYFGGVCADSILTATTFDFNREGELDLGTVSLVYKFTYQTCAPEAPTTLDDFDTAYVTHKQGSDQADADDAEDNIEVSA